MNQMIYMKCQVLFPLKNNFKKFRMSSATIFLSVLLSLTNKFDHILVCTISGHVAVPALTEFLC